MNPASPLPGVVEVRPMVMLTGFLGAGKTTFLRSLLDDLLAREHRADVILNDRENAQIDSETLVGKAASIETLTESCVCCDGSDELYALILKSSTRDHDALLLELNGTADPIPLHESFTLLESKFCLRPRWQVCLIDSRHFGQRNAYNQLEELQLETASHYSLSWASQLSGKDELELEAAIQAINPHATRITPTLLADALSQAIRHNQRRLITTTNPRPEQSLTGRLQVKPTPDERHQIAHEFTGCNLILPQAVDSRRIQPWLNALPETVVRAKALLIHDDEPDCRYLYERVGQEVSPWPLTVRSLGKVPCSALFIGPDLDPEAILAQTRELLHPACHFAKP